MLYTLLVQTHTVHVSADCTVHVHTTAAANITHTQHTTIEHTNLNETKVGQRVTFIPHYERQQTNSEQYTKKNEEKKRRISIALTCNISIRIYFECSVNNKKHHPSTECRTAVHSVWFLLLNARMVSRLRTHTHTHPGTPWHTHTSAPSSSKNASWHWQLYHHFK